MSKQLIFTVLIVLTVTLVVLPTHAYALSIYIVPPSKFVINLLDLLLRSIIILFIISFTISAFLIKNGKTASKFAKITVKFLAKVGIILLVFRLALIFAPWELIDNYYVRNFKFSDQYQYQLVTEKIVVGFKKGVSQEKAEEYLKSKKVKFIRTENVNMGKVFFYNTDLKYIVTFPSFGISNLITEFDSSSLVYDAAKYSDNPNELID